MRIAYLECFSGISGDMMLGALLDAGVSAELLQKTVSSLHLGAELRIAPTDRSGVCATKVDAVVEGRDQLVREPAGKPRRRHNGARAQTHEDEAQSAQKSPKVVQRDNPHRHA